MVVNSFVNQPTDIEWYNTPLDCSRYIYNVAPPNRYCRVPYDSATWPHLVFLFRVIRSGRATMEA